MKLKNRASLKFLCLILTLFFILFPQKIKAQSSVEIKAKVQSPVSAENSTVYLSTHQTIADPISHPVLLVIELKDKNGNPLPDKAVKITSIRGPADVLESTGKLSRGEADEMDKDRTDKEGKVSFRLTSFYPGKAEIKILADTEVRLKDEEVIFKAKPFPTYLSISVDLPFSQRDLIIIPSSLNKEKLTALQRESIELINPSGELKIPFWIFVLIFIAAVVVPLIVIFNLFNLGRVKKMEKQEIEILRIMAKNDTLFQDYLKNKDS